MKAAPGCFAASGQRKTVAAVATVLLIIGITTWAILQPRYQGKSVRTWFYRIEAKEPGQAHDAFRAMGQMAVPFLVCRLERPPNMMLHRLLSMVMPDWGTAYRQHQNAWQCRAAFLLGELGPAAKSAEGSLVQATSSENWALRGCAEVALMKIRGEPIQPLIDQLNDTSDYAQWYQTAMKVADFGVQAKPAVPILLKSLGHTNNIIQAHALIALGMIRCEPEKCVPAIVPFLGSRSVGLRQKAMGALLGFGTNALPARTAIQAALNDSDPWVRAEAQSSMAILGQTNRLVVP